MNSELADMQGRLQLERQELLGKLQEIDDDLASVDRVLDLMKAKKVATNDKQLPLPSQNNELLGPKTRKFETSSFREAVSILFKENPGKHWKPREIADSLIENGFPTRSQKFKNTVRTLLGNLRRSGDIVATLTKAGWIYSSMKTGRIERFELTNEDNNK